MFGNIVLFDGITVSICNKRYDIDDVSFKKKNELSVSLFWDTNPKFLVFEYQHHIPDVLPMIKCKLINRYHNQDLRKIEVLLCHFYSALVAISTISMLQSLHLRKRIWMDLLFLARSMNEKGKSSVIFKCK